MIGNIASFDIFLDWLTATSVQGSLLICLVLIVQAVLGGRLSPRARYAMWLVVVVRLAMPIAPASSVSVYNVLPTGESVFPAQLTDLTLTKSQLQAASTFTGRDW